MNDAIPGLLQDIQVGEDGDLTFMPELLPESRIRGMIIGVRGIRFHIRITAPFPAQCLSDFVDKAVSRERKFGVTCMGTPKVSIQIVFCIQLKLP